MSRDFTEVVNAIKVVAPQSLKNALDRSVDFWAPENKWAMLSDYVNKYVRPSSKDAVSVAVFARLCGCTEGEMRARFLKDNL